MMHLKQQEAAMSTILDSITAEKIITNALTKIVNNDDAYFDKLLSSSSIEKKCEKAFDKFVRNAKEKPEIALRFLVLAFSCGPLVIKYSYKKNTFKPSSYDYACPKHFYIYLEYIRDNMDIEPDVKSYICSIIHLISIQSELKKEYEIVINFIKNVGKPFLKTVIAWTELIFLLNVSVRLDNQTVAQREVLAEACSYLVAIYFHIFPSQVYNQEDIDVDSYEAYLDLIKKAISIKQYLYEEMSLGKLPYIVERTETGIVFRAASDQYERCRRAGFSVLEMKANQVKASVLRNKEHQDFTDSLMQQADELSEMLVAKRDNPERYALRFVDNNGLLKSFFDHDGIYRDELAYIKYICTQFHVDSKTLLSFELANKLTVDDLLKIKRFFTFISIVFGRKLQNELNNGIDKKIILRSIIPVYEKQSLIACLASIFDKSSSEAFLDVFSYVPGKHRIIDLQYRPFIFLGGGYYFLPQVFQISDNIRNTLFAHAQRFFPDNTREPVVDMAHDALSTRITLTKSKYKINPREIDCISITDNYIFLFEVKNTFLPCNKAEERTTYEYLIEAASQLEEQEKLLSKRKTREQILRDFKVDIGNKIIKKCILLGTRALTGLYIEGVPVRYIDELVNFMVTGKGIEKFEEVSLWESDSFSEQDLVRFVDSGGSALLYAELCRPLSEKYSLGNATLTNETYYITYEDILPPEVYQRLRELPGFEDVVQGNGEA